MADLTAADWIIDETYYDYTGRELVLESIDHHAGYPLSFTCDGAPFDDYGWNGEFLRGQEGVKDIVRPEDLLKHTPVNMLPDTGDRTQFETGAVRDAMSGKGLPSLIPPESIRRLARRFEDGAEKYGRDNWQKGIPLSRYNDAIIRHTLAAAEGQDDEDHLGAVLWNAAAWIWTEGQIAKGNLPQELMDLTYRW